MQYSFKEDILQHIFQYKLFNTSNLKTSTGEDLKIIKTGNKNFNAGPDFLNAHIKIGDTQLAGNIEIHKFSSDWNNHNHQNNLAYSNIILHVVYLDNEPLKQNNQLVPTLILKPIVNENLFEKYEQLLKSKKFVPCQKNVSTIPSIVLNSWIDRMIAERMDDKSAMAKQILANTNNNWEETFYQMLAYTFGFGVNKLVFLKLAQTLPLNILAKHKNNLLQLEALIFGIAGMLDDFFEDEYPKQLQNEYQFLKKKYGIQSFISKQEWMFAKMHPVNFPTIRLAQFASLIFNSSHLFSRIVKCNSVSELQILFKASTSVYWLTHYVFGKPSSSKVKLLGQSSVNLILINTVAPILYIYANVNIVYREKAMQFLQQIKSESNSIIKSWSGCGVESASAYTSQALLHLKQSYCDNKKCLQCALGNYLIKN